MMIMMIMIYISIAMLYWIIVLNDDKINDQMAHLCLPSGKKNIAMEKWWVSIAMLDL
jgi:hypothetical protein